MKKPKIPRDCYIIEGDIKRLNYYQNNNVGLPSEFYFDKIDNAEKFFMVVVREEKNDKPAAICWLYTKKQINRVIKLRDNEVEMKHGITLRFFRNKGIFSSLVDYMMYKIKLDGFTRVVNLIEVNNYPSLRVFQRYGFKVVAEKTYCKFMGFRVSALYKTLP